MAASATTTASQYQDSIWYNEEQACNVSLSKDSTKRTVFLDFAGKTGQSFAGEKYGIHKRLLIADSTGDLIQTVASPMSSAFDHSEWISRMGSLKDSLVVTSLTNSDGAHTKIALVNINDNSITNLIEGDDLWHPCLWANATPSSDKNIDLDSAGLYFDGSALLFIHH